jgi:hypothetical protein
MTHPYDNATLGERDRDGAVEANLLRDQDEADKRDDKAWRKAERDATDRRAWDAHARETYVIGPFTVVRRADDWHACLTGQASVWGRGRSIDEAIGAVVRTAPEVVTAAGATEGATPVATHCEGRVDLALRVIDETIKQLAVDASAMAAKFPQFDRMNAGTGPGIRLAALTEVRDVIVREALLAIESESGPGSATTAAS